MKIMVHWEIHPEKRAEALAAFAGMELSDYQSQQGPEIEVLGRWHDVNNFTGVAILELSDAAALGEYLMQWNAVADFSIVPVLNDEEAHALCRSMISSD